VSEVVKPMLRKLSMGSRLRGNDEAVVAR
jgi:hypothetical protein